MLRRLLTRQSAAADRGDHVDARARRELCLEPGVYFGTSTGQLFASADEGESWSEIASYLPGITSVEVAIVD